MKRLSMLIMYVAAFAIGSMAFAQTPDAPEGWVPVTELLPLPEFIPGAGALYVQPDNAPVGPWLAYGQDGTLIEVLFMVPVSQMQEAVNWDDLATGTLAELGITAIDHVDISYNGGHPGMAEPHYHFRLVLVDAATQAAALNP